MNARYDEKMNRHVQRGLHSKASQLVRRVVDDRQQSLFDWPNLRKQHEAIAVPVRIRGVDYPSQTAAAKAFGVSRTAIWKALENGTIDQIGLRKYKAFPAQPITWEGVEYASIGDAAAALGITRRAFLYRRQNVGKIRLPKAPPKPTWWGDTLYPTRYAARREALRQGFPILSIQALIKADPRNVP